MWGLSNLITNFCRKKLGRAVTDVLIFYQILINCRLKCCAFRWPYSVWCYCVYRQWITSISLIIIVGLSKSIFYKFIILSCHFYYVAGKLVPFLENSVAHASVLTILTISFERYFAICYPLMCSTRRSIIIITIVWIVALLSASPYAIINYTAQEEYVNTTIVTVCRAPLIETWMKLYVISTTVLFFALPFCLLTIIYSIIIVKMSTESKSLCKSSGSGREVSGSSNGLQARRKTVMMIGVVVVLFFVCLLPIRVLTIWLAYAQVKDVHALGFEGWQNLTSFVRVMFYMNSATNPVVYNLMSSRFRQAFLKMLGIKKASAMNYTMHTHIPLSCRSSNVWDWNANQRRTSQQLLHTWEFHCPRK